MTAEDYVDVDLNHGEHLIEVMPDVEEEKPAVIVPPTSQSVKGKQEAALAAVGLLSIEDTVGRDEEEGKESIITR